MSTLKCKNCGGLTNTALSKYNLRNISDGAEECYAVWINDKWERGCAFDENSDDFLQQFAKRIINKKIDNSVEEFFNA